MSQAPNPFCNRGVITDPDDFFGRETQIAEIITRLATMQSTSVVGERRIGKSSLLYHLCQTGARRLKNESYRFCYVDLQDAHYHTAVGFFETVLHKIEASADAIKAENSPNGNLVAFTDQIDALERAGQRLVFAREYGNFLVGRFDPKKLRKAKRLINKDNIKELLDAIKSLRGK